MPDHERGDRFIGPVVLDGKLAGEVDLAAVPAFGAAGDVSDLVVDGTTLSINVWADIRHALVRFRTRG